MSGGSFSNPGDPDQPYRFLDHVQLHTANADITFKTDANWATFQGLYGSGLRTRSDNSGNLP
ncbi:MAG: hypothetical protein C5B49_05815 [Bdellovibrio sp.]|nr:MAG: hypothetical protein C5B49_05815 [Bdellovibrio sp.]